jgi:hypothetical protein
MFFPHFLRLNSLKERNTYFQMITDYSWPSSQLIRRYITAEDKTVSLKILLLSDFLLLRTSASTDNVAHWSTCLLVEGSLFHCLNR